MKGKKERKEKGRQIKKRNNERLRRKSGKGKIQARSSISASGVTLEGHLAGHLTCPKLIQVFKINGRSSGLDRNGNVATQHTFSGWDMAMFSRLHMKLLTTDLKQKTPRNVATQQTFTGWDMATFPTLHMKTLHHWSKTKDASYRQITSVCCVYTASMCFPSKS